MLSKLDHARIAKLPEAKRPEAMARLYLKKLKKLKKARIDNLKLEIRATRERIRKGSREVQRREILTLISLKHKLAAITKPI